MKNIKFFKYNLFLTNRDNYIQATPWKLKLTQIVCRILKP